MDYGITEYSEWVLAHPGQAVLTVVSIRLIFRTRHSGHNSACSYSGSEISELAE